MKAESSRQVRSKGLRPIVAKGNSAKMSNFFLKKREGKSKRFHSFFRRRFGKVSPLLTLEVSPPPLSLSPSDHACAGGKMGSKEGKKRKERKGTKEKDKMRRKEKELFLKILC